MLCAFLKEHPNVDVIFGKNRRLCRWRCLSDVNWMWGFGEWPPNPSAGFTSIRLRDAAFLVAMPEDHHLVHETAISLRLQNEYFVTMPSAHSDWAFYIACASRPVFHHDCP
jgi:DNA-binding transcriptional LysR family regulator